MRVAGRMAAALLALVPASCVDVTGAETDFPAAGERVELPEPRRSGQLGVEDALARRRSVRDFAADPLRLEQLAQLAWAAQGITASGGRRTAPSAGALYPLELYWVVGAVEGLEPGIYHYRPAGHHLERHASGDVRSAVARAAYLQLWVGEAPAVLVIAGVLERTAAKYGKRAPRYVYMETGHAAQNVYLEAEALGLGTCMVGAFADAQLRRVLALPEGVEPLALLPVGAPS